MFFLSPHNPPPKITRKNKRKSVIKSLTVVGKISEKGKAHVP
jgi:hypothetical protein